jgi:hypothetical protein
MTVNLNADKDMGMDTEMDHIHDRFRVRYPCDIFRVNNG